MFRQSSLFILSGVTITITTFLMVLLLPVCIQAEQATPIIEVGSEVDFPPYAIVDAKGHASGFSVELLEAVAEAMGLVIEIHTGPWPEVLAVFKAGKYDLLPLVALSAKRADMAAYTKPHTVAYDSFFVRRGSRPITSLAEASGKEVVVMTNDAAHEALVVSGLPVRIVEATTIPEAMRLLAADRHDAVLVPKLLGHLVLQELKLTDVIKAGPPIADYKRQFAFAVQPGNTDLCDKLEQGLAIVRATGRYDAIYKKWFGSIEPHGLLSLREILWSAGIITLLALLVSAWVLSLRRQVARRTAKLKASYVTMEDLKKEIAERMRAEEALQRAHDELEQRVKERTMALQKTHAQLRHAEKLSAIGRLSASIAHEFNNPLQGVMNVIKGVRRRVPLAEDDAELVDMAITECHRMRDLIKSFQAFNRPTSGKETLMDIHAAIDSLLLLGKKEYEARKIAIKKDYAEEMPQIQAVADQIKQVLLNLFNNAVDACENGGTVTIRTEARQENIIVRIEDTGKGIRPEDMEHIFEPFFSTKPEVKGTGLGLSVSYGIVKAHNGDIKIKSEVGKGSVFSVILPSSGGQIGHEENSAG